MCKFLQKVLFDPHWTSPDLSTFFFSELAMKLNVAFPATGCQKLFEINDEHKARQITPQRKSIFEIFIFVFFLKLALCFHESGYLKLRVIKLNFFKH